jgi:hypothetical protein
VDKQQIGTGRMQGKSPPGGPERAEAAPADGTRDGDGGKRRNRPFRIIFMRRDVGDRVPGVARIWRK